MPVRVRSMEGLGVWDDDLCIRTWSSSGDGCDYWLSRDFDARPTRCAEDDDCDCSWREILLVLEVRICRDQNLKALSFGRSEQLTILEGRPAALVRSGYLVPWQQLPQRRRCTLIEQDSHLCRG